MSPTLRPRSRGGTAQHHRRAELPPLPSPTLPSPGGLGALRAGCDPPAQQGMPSRVTAVAPSLGHLHSPSGGTRTTGLRRGTGVPTGSLTLPAPHPGGGRTTLQGRAHLGDGAPLGCREQVWAQGGQARAPGSKGVTTGERWGPENRLQTPGSLCSHGRAQVPLGTPATPGAPAPPAPGRSQPQERLLQVQVPREVESASFRLVQVPRNVAVVEMIITGMSSPLIPPCLPNEHLRP